MACEGAIAERRLIINADDLGLSPAVNRGIFEAHAAGTVTSASLFANMPGLDDAVSHLRELPTLSVGLHFNLTVGPSVADPTHVSSLCDPRNETFYPLPRLLVRALTARIAAAHVAAEFTAQLDRLRSVGVTVRHIDSHRHVHAFPGIWNAVVAVARHAGVPMRVRAPREPLLLGSTPLARSLVTAALGTAWRIASGGRNGDRDLRRADHFRGLALHGTPDFQRRLLALLDHLERGTTELMVHPGYVDPELMAWDSYTTGRERELAALCSREVRERLTRGDLRLVA